MKKAISVLLALTVILSIAAFVPLSAGAAEIGTTDAEESVEYVEADVSSDAVSVDEAVGAGEDTVAGTTAETSEAVTDAAEKPAAPTLSLSNTAAGLNASWNAVPNAESYVMYFRTDPAQAWSSLETGDTSLLVPDAESGTRYYVQVRSMGANGVSGGYSKVRSLTYIGRAVITGAVYDGSANILSWSGSAGANKFQIAKRRAGASAYTYITTADYSYTDAEIDASASYQYQVRAMYATENNGTAYGAWSYTKSVVTIIQPVVSLSNKSNGIRAQWSACNGATKYVVYFKSAAAAPWSSAETANTYYPILNTESGTTYFVQVRAVSNDVNGPYSRVTSLTFFGRPSTSANVTETGVTLSWNAINGANGYEVAKKKKGDSVYTYYTVDRPSFSDNHIAGNTAYCYQVRAKSANPNGSAYYGEWSATQTVLRVDPPEVSLSNKSNGIRAEWNKVLGATKYIVSYKPYSGSDWSSAETVNTYYPVLGVTSGTLYCVRVRAVFGTAFGVYSKTKTLTFIGQPSVRMSMSGTDLKLSWNGINGANQFQIAKRKRGESAYTYTVTSNNTFVEKNAASLSDYYTYQVRAMYRTASSGTAYGAWSGVYHFGNGKVLNGYVTDNGKKYYYQNGVLKKNGIVGSKSEGYYYADSDGVCCVSEEMRLAAEFIMNCATGNTLDERMKTGFKYLTDKFPYVRTYDHPKSKSDIPALAIDMFKNRKGNCFRYAACFTCVARLCGYRARIAVGNTSNGSPHGWTEVYMDGKWYYFDPDMQLPGFGFPAYYAYKMTVHPWNVRSSFKSEVTISNGKAVWN